MGTFKPLKELKKGDSIIITPATKVLHNRIAFQVIEPTDGVVTEVIRKQNRTTVKVRIKANDTGNDIIVELSSLYLLAVEIIEDAKDFWSRLKAIFQKVFPPKKK